MRRLWRDLHYRYWWWMYGGTREERRARHYEAATIGIALILAALLVKALVIR